MIVTIYDVNLIKTQLKSRSPPLAADLFPYRKNTVFFGGKVF